MKVVKVGDNGSDKLVYIIQDQSGNEFKMLVPLGLEVFAFEGVIMVEKLKEGRI